MSTASAPCTSPSSSTRTPPRSPWWMRRARRCRRFRQPLAAQAGAEFVLDFDQSVFVRAAVQNVIREAIISSVLVSVLILVFLGSWRNTVIVSASHPAIDLRRRHGPVPHRQQPINLMNSGRIGTRHRSVGGQRHRHHREHSSQPVARQISHGGDPRRHRRGDPAADRRHPRHLHRVLSRRAAERRGALSVPFRSPPPSCSACSPPTCCRSAWCPVSRASC